MYAEKQPQHVSGITSTECDVNTHKLTLLTFNIEGLAGDFSYLTILACRANFMLLQEHWLHNCDKNRLQECLPDFNCYSKCHDDNVASDPIERRRGKEGVAICVKKKYSHLIEPQALEFQTPLFPHLVPPAIMVWIFVWKYIFEPFIHILQYFVL